jgi:hypothetical protein
MPYGSDEYPDLMNFSGGKSRRGKREPAGPKLSLTGKLQGMMIALLTAAGSIFAPAVQRRVALWIRHVLTLLAGALGMAAAQVESGILMASGLLAAMVMAGLAVLWSQVEKLLDNGHEDPTEVIRRPAEVLPDDYEGF